MAKLSENPEGIELEDFISAHFASRGCYVETSLVERGPEDILELDIVWTDYRNDPEVKRPVEVKSGSWHLADVFKFYGWTRYLELEPGQFIHKEPNGRVSSETLDHVGAKTCIQFWHVSRPDDAHAYLNRLGLPSPVSPGLAGLWRFSFWLRRRLRRSLSEAIASKVCPASAKAAKGYLKLVNDAVFFTSDVRLRVERLISAHFEHQRLGQSAAYETDTGTVDFQNPPPSRAFKQAYFWGKHFPIQACLYAAHRARLYILKALVDYWLGVQRGSIKERRVVVKLNNKAETLTMPGFTAAMQCGLEELSRAKSFRLFPVFWQTFLWSWGGFLLGDRLEQEYALLEAETGVLKEEIPIALSAFDQVFPIEGGWFRNPVGDNRRVLILMPAAIRGLGAYRRLMQGGVEEYSELKCSADTAWKMAGDHNSAVRLLDCVDVELTK